MDIATVIGLVSGAACILLGIVFGSGRLAAFMDSGAVMITIGGTIAALFISHSIKDLANIGRVLKKAFQGERFDLKASIDKIIALANMARKEGLLALEDTVHDLNDPFLEKGVMLVVDGTDPELVKSIMEAEISFLEARHRKGAGLFDTIASMAPAYGMLGTLIGLIIMLENLDDPAALGPGMAVALITTFYGSVIANLVALPISNKLKARSSDEALHMELLLVGLLSIQAGENPRLIEERLYAFLARSEKQIPSETEDVGDDSGGMFE